MHKSKIRVYSTSQLLFIFVQFLSPALAVPCYVGTSTTTKSDTTSGPEQCSVTERIPSSTAGSVTSSHTAKTTAPSPIGAPTPIFSLEKNDNADLSVPIKLNSTTPLLNPKNPINPLNLTTPFPPRAGSDYSASIYSTSGFYVECESSQSIYDDFVPHGYIPEITPEHWPDWADYSHEDAITFIQYEQSKCESCHCDENGLIGAFHEGHPDHCPDEDFVNVCISLYGCSCRIEMETEPPEEPFVDPTKVDDTDFINRVTTQDISEYQDTTKDMILYGAFNRWWQSKTKKKSENGLTGAEAKNNARNSRFRSVRAAERYFVPGEKEPWYLEGPNSGRDWNSLSLGSVSDGGSFWKRGKLEGQRSDGDKTDEGEDANKDGSAEEEQEGSKDKDGERKVEGEKTSKKGQR